MGQWGTGHPCEPSRWGPAEGRGGVRAKQNPGGMAGDGPGCQPARAFIRVAGHPGIPDVSSPTRLRLASTAPRVREAEALARMGVGEQLLVLGPDSVLLRLENQLVAGGLVDDGLAVLGDLLRQALAQPMMKAATEPSTGPILLSPPLVGLAFSTSAALWVAARPRSAARTSSTSTAPQERPQGVVQARRGDHGHDLASKARLGAHGADQRVHPSGDTLSRKSLERSMVSTLISSWRLALLLAELGLVDLASNPYERPWPCKPRPRPAGCSGGWPWRSGPVRSAPKTGFASDFSAGFPAAACWVMYCLPVWGELADIDQVSPLDKPSQSMGATFRSILPLTRESPQMCHGRGQTRRS